MEQTAKIYFEQGPVVEFECFRAEVIKKGVVILGNTIVWNKENKCHLMEASMKYPYVVVAIALTTDSAKSRVFLKNGQYSKFVSLLGCTASERTTSCIRKINYLVDYLKEAINQSFDGRSIDKDDIEHLTIGELRDIVSKFPEEK